MDAMLLLKASLLLLLALFIARLLRRRSAVTRHRLWTAAFVALLALPVLASALPALDVPLPAAWRASARQAMALDPERRDAARAVAPGPAADLEVPARQDADVNGVPQRSGGFTLPLSARAIAPLAAIWLGGTTAAVTALLLSLLRVRRLARTAADLGDPAWRDEADALASRLGLRCQPRLLVSPRVGTPMAGGVWRPVVFLPPSACEWSAEQRHVVLAHELAHLAGRDPLRHLAARLAVAVYWFHPLAWIAARHSTISREQACDETVLALGTRPSTYAAVLLDLAESMRPSIRALEALPMVEPSLLEARVMSILNDRPRPAAGRWGLTLAIGAVVLTLSVAAAQPAAPVPVVSVARVTAASTVSLAGEIVAVPAVQPKASVASWPPVFSQADLGRDSACWWDSSSGASFSGNISISEVGGRTIIHEQIGTRGTDRVIQKSFDDVQLCMVAEGAGDRATADRPSQWPGRARRVVMEARRGRDVQRLEVAGAGQKISWQVGGKERSFDAAAQQWRDRMLAALDTTWELSMLHGQVSSFRGEISSIHGQESSLRGEISSLRGEVSSMEGRISSIRGEESSLRGRISSIQGHVSSLRGAISSEQGAISSINGGRYGADRSERAALDARIERHEAEIARLEREIRDYAADARIKDVEQEIGGFGGRVARVQEEIRAFDLDGKVAAVQRRIADLDVKGKVADIERRIEALDADRRGRQLEARRDSELKQLDAAITAIR